LYRDSGDGTFDLSQVVGLELDGKCADVLIQAIQLPAARDGNNPWLLSEQPGERDLSRCRSLLFSDPGQQINYRPVGFPRLRV